jgi:hypothetical protein
MTALCASLLLGGCQDDPMEPTRTEPRDTTRATEPRDTMPRDTMPRDTLPAVDRVPTGLTRATLRPEGKVTTTADGYMLEGSLHMGPTTFTHANVRVRFDASDRVTSISGTVEIPSPHERISFADPVRADIGVFTGRFLNQNRDLGILLKDNTDYFVFDLSVALELRIATGETGGNATRPLVVRAPLGGRLLMVVDYTDPMYYVYGAQDLIGAAGIGWSYNGRIPFVPKVMVKGLGVFDGKNTRVGSFPVLKVLTVTGQMVDNNYTEAHLSLKDPFSSNLRAGYQAGYNGSMSLDLFLKDIAGIEIPIADGSGGLWAEGSVQGEFRGHAYVAGATSRDASWWPAFIPARPVTELDAKAFIKSDGDFEVGLAGEFGWEMPSGRHSMMGAFDLTPGALTLSGAIRDADVVFKVTGRVTRDATTVFVEPPRQLLDAVAGSVNEQMRGPLATAQSAWDDLKKATADYEFELSLRGLRSGLPAAMDAAHKTLADAVKAELAKHAGEVYYNQLRTRVLDEVDPYYDMLDGLKAAALQIRDNDQTRKTLETALRGVAANKIFHTTFQYKVLGVVVKTVTVDKRIMSDADAAKLIAAANNVKYIKERSDVMISMKQIYERVPDRQIFEELRDDLRNGVLVMADIGELGFIFVHDSKTFEVYAVIDGKRHELGSIDAFSLAAWVAALPSAMIEALRSN